MSKADGGVEGPEEERVEDVDSGEELPLKRTRRGLDITEGECQR